MYRPSRWSGIAFAAVVFLAGIVAGIALTNPCKHGNLTPAAAQAKGPAVHGEFYAHELQRILGLSDEQRRQVAQIVAANCRGHLDAMQMADDIRIDGIVRIRAMLTEEQRKRFDQILKDEAARPRP